MAQHPAFKRAVYRLLVSAAFTDLSRKTDENVVWARETKTTHCCQLACFLQSQRRLFVNLIKVCNSKDFRRGGTDVVWDAAQVPTDPPAFIEQFAVAQDVEQFVGVDGTSLGGHGTRWRQYDVKVAFLEHDSGRGACVSQEDAWDDFGLLPVVRVFFGCVDVLECEGRVYLPPVVQEVAVHLF